MRGLNHQQSHLIDRVCPLKSYVIFLCILLSLFNLSNILYTFDILEERHGKETHGIHARKPTSPADSAGLVHPTCWFISPRLSATQTVSIGT